MFARRNPTTQGISSASKIARITLYINVLGTKRPSSLRGPKTNSQIAKVSEILVFDLNMESICTLSAVSRRVEVII
jgi:hypothetical protein